VKTIILLILTCTVLSPAQQRILVSPNGDARALTGRENVAAVVRAEARKSLSAVCSAKGTFGYSTQAYPGANVQVEAFHRDIMAMWYVVPANGTIDTVFVYNLDVGTEDSTVTVRIFNSNVYPGSGPGYGGYPKPGKLCWGYYLNTNDDDNGLAAFPEDATDTTWHSTVPGAIPSSTPMGAEIWGSGGFPKAMSAFTTNFISLSELATLNVTAGQPIFITIKMYGAHREQVDDKRTGYIAASESDSLQTHNWKFYEHIYQGPGFTCPGWVARGDFNYLIWYSMTVTSNLPPTFSDVTPVTNTFSTDDQPVQATIIDCDAAVPGRAGVEDALLRYSRNGVPQPDIALAYLGGDVWEAAIPGGEINDRFAYRIVASDSTGSADSSASNEYRIVSLSNAWYAADTGAACTARDIRLTGTGIPSSAYFVPAYPGSGTLPKDDGTAGPFDMGSSFTVFGDTFRYAWIGVNGALALGKSPLDTLDVNSNGFGTRLWDFPNAQKSGREDTAGSYDMPGMFIAPFWADMIAGSGATEYGRTVYGDDGDTCLFIAEWDSLGSFDTGDPVADGTTFRAVLNRCTGAIEFQYDNVGSNGLETTALVGMQADSNSASGPDPGWVYVNRDAAPAGTVPRAGWCIRFSPTIGTLALDGWNMVAVSHEPADGDYSKTTLFPSSGNPAAVSAGFRYSAGYVSSDTLVRGRGYWLKFNGAGRSGASAGSFVNSVTAPVQDKWNMVGGPSGTVPTASIQATGTAVASSFFGYGASGYYPTTMLREGQGYWVKVAGTGTLGMVSSAALPKTIAAEPPVEEPSKLNSITIFDAAGHQATLWFGEAPAIGADAAMFELPPPPPAGAFDARFASGRYVESVVAAPTARGATVLPLSVTGAAWPLTVTWEIRESHSSGARFVLGSGDGSAIRPLEGSGSVIVHAEPAGGLALRLSADAGVPTEYALGSNYPNPFNPATRFEIGIAADGPVNVTVYDLLGREVRSLVDGRMSAGTRTLEWDGRNGEGAFAPSGVYIVRLLAGQFTASKKIVLMK
jgi:hypothetical protein